MNSVFRWRWNSACQEFLVREFIWYKLVKAEQSLAGRGGLFLLHQLVTFYIGGSPHLSESPHHIHSQMLGIIVMVVDMHRCFLWPYRTGPTTVISICRGISPPACRSSQILSVTYRPQVFVLRSVHQRADLTLWKFPACVHMAPLDAVRITVHVWKLLQLLNTSETFFWFWCLHIKVAPGLY